jgi:hypothetical protein
MSANLDRSSIRIRTSFLKVPEVAELLGVKPRTRLRLHQSRHGTALHGHQESVRNGWSIGGD